MISRILTILTVLCAAVVSQGQEGQAPILGSGSDLWGKNVASVKVEGVQSADTFLVINSSGLVIGDQLTPGMVQDAVKGVYALGLFSDVQIDAVSDGNRGGGNDQSYRVSQAQ